jgi:uncharacterized membrane protein
MLTTVLTVFALGAVFFVLCFLLMIAVFCWLDLSEADR